MRPKLSRLHARNKSATENRWTMPHSKSNRWHHLNLIRLFVVLYTELTRRLLNKINFLRGRIKATLNRNRRNLYLLNMRRHYPCFVFQPESERTNATHKTNHFVQLFVVKWNVLHLVIRFWLKSPNTSTTKWWNWVSGFKVQFTFPIYLKFIREFCGSSMRVEAAAANLSRCKSKC